MYYPAAPTLPGGGSQLYLSPDGTEFFALVDSYLDGDERALVHRAFKLAEKEHGDRQRQSGEPYFTHPLTVAYYLAEYRLGAAVLVAALLHDVAEDTRVSITDIENSFGSDISRLVDGVTKLKDVSRGVAQGRKLSRSEINEASLHKLFDFTSQDVRVVIIKIFDRLHNMRTIGALPRHKQLEKANETLAVYAPIANRLGMWGIKGELESLSLQVVDKSAYDIITARLNKLARQHFIILPNVKQQIVDQLALFGLRPVDIYYSPRQPYAIYRELRSRGGSYQDIDSSMRLVILLDETLLCYTALGALHQLWPPVPHKFDDYIAVARDNLYRSLHTTVIHDSGQPLKLRLRTVEMDRISEIGTLARWRPEQTPMWAVNVQSKVDAFLADIRENIELEPGNVGFGVQGVVDNVLRDQIRVYTPAGEERIMRKGATPIDFAYLIHTEVGHHCYAAYVHGVRVPLNQALRDGDQVRIEKRDRARPQRIWLDEDLGYMVTSKAKSMVGRWFRRLPAEQVLAEGEKLLHDELNVLGFPDYPQEELARAFGCNSQSALYRALGLAELLPTELSTRVAEATWSIWPARTVGSEVISLDGGRFVITHAEGRALRLCRVCRPRPGDRILGFLRSDEQVTVHEANCYMLKIDPFGGRTLRLGWGDGEPAEVRLVAVETEVHDRVGLLYDITQLLYDEHINIDHLDMPRRSREKQMVFELEVPSPRRLVRVLHRIMALLNVYSVTCLPDNLSRSHRPEAGELYLPE